MFIRPDGHGASFSAEVTAEEAVYTFGDFTEMEKLLFESGNMQERLWAIYLYLIDPNMNL